MNTNLTNRPSDSRVNRIVTGAFQFALIGMVGILTFAQFMTLA